MHKRYLVSKTFSQGVVTQALIYEGMTLSKGILDRYGDSDTDEVPTIFLKNVPTQISLNCDISTAKSYFESNDKLDALVLSEGDCGFKNLSEQCRGGILLDMLKSDEDLRKSLSELSVTMFHKVNSKTGAEDVKHSDKFAPYIPFVVVSGALPPQLDFASSTYFNPRGTVTVARALDSLNAIKEGYASNKCRRVSVDYVSNESDFFNEGYNECLETVASPFFRLFSRSELLTPITMAELCYLIVVCFKPFREVYGSVNGYSGEMRNKMGIALDWEHPKKIIKEYRQKFSDLSDYVVTRCSVDTYTKEDEVKSVLDVNIKSYLSGRTITDFRQDLLSGKSALPLPYLMSMLELINAGILDVTGRELAPLREVSRGEFSQVLVALASKLYSN